MNKDIICSDKNSKISDYKSLTKSVPEGNKRYKNVWKEFVCFSDGASVVSKKRKTYNLVEFAKLVRKIKKLEKTKNEKSLSIEDNEKLEKFKKKLLEYSDNLDEPKIKDSLELKIEKIDEEQSVNYLKVIFPEIFKNKLLLDSINLKRKRTGKKLNSNSLITNLIQSVLENFSDEKMNFEKLNVKIDDKVETFILSEKKIKEKKEKKEKEIEEISKLIIDITKDLDNQIFSDDLQTCLGGKKKLGFLPKATRNLLENEIDDNDGSASDYFFRLNTIGDGNCLVHAILQLIDPDYPQYDNFEKLDFKQKKIAISKLEYERKKYVAIFREYLGNSINEDIFNFIGNQNDFDSLENYKKYISTDKKWLDKSDIPIIGSFLNVNIFLFTYSEGDDMPYNPVCIEKQYYNEEFPTILIYNVYEQHYESIIRVIRNSPILKDKTLDEFKIKENSQYSFIHTDRIIDVIKYKYLLDCNQIIPHMFVKNWNKSYCKELDMIPADEQGYCPVEKPYRKEFIEEDAVCCLDDKNLENQNINNLPSYVNPNTELWIESSNKEQILKDSYDNDIKLKLELVRETIGDENLKDYGEEKIIDLIRKGLDIDIIIDRLLNKSENNSTDNESHDSDGESDDEITECDIVFEGKSISVEIHSDDTLWYKFKKNKEFTKVGRIIYTSNNQGKAIWDSNYREMILNEN